MSASIGPIHLYLFNKIKFQESVVKVLYNIEDISNEVDLNNGILPIGNLEDLIDNDNIHGWLQDQINIVENRLADTTTKLINKGYTINQLLECIAKNIKIDYEIVETATEAYTVLDKYLLNGMPCDKVNKLIIENSEKVLFIETKQIHNEYWILNNGDTSNYYLIKKAMANVILSKTKFNLDSNDQHEFEIKLKEN
jgi:hypothetical protein